MSFEDYHPDVQQALLRAQADPLWEVQVASMNALWDMDDRTDVAEVPQLQLARTSLERLISLPTAPQTETPHSNGALNTEAIDSLRVGVEQTSQTVISDITPQPKSARTLIKTLRGQELTPEERYMWAQPHSRGTVRRAAGRLATRVNEFLDNPDALLYPTVDDTSVTKAPTQEAATQENITSNAVDRDKGDPTERVPHGDDSLAPGGRKRRHRNASGDKDGATGSVEATDTPHTPTQEELIEMALGAPCEVVLPWKNDKQQGTLTNVMTYIDPMTGKKVLFAEVFEPRAQAERDSLDMNNPTVADEIARQKMKIVTRAAVADHTMILPGIQPFNQPYRRAGGAYEGRAIYHAWNKKPSAPSVFADVCRAADVIGGYEGDPETLFVGFIGVSNKNNQDRVSSIIEGR